RRNVERCGRFCGIGIGADGDEHLAVVLRECNVAGPVATPRRQRGDDFRLFRRAEIAIGVREAHNRLGIRYVNPLRIITLRVKGNAKVVLQARCKYLVAADFISAFRGSEDTDAPSCTFGDEDIPIRGYANEPRLIETACEKFDLESRKDLQLRIGRLFNYCHGIPAWGRGVGGQKIRSSDVTANYGGVRSPITVSRLAFKHGILRENR